MVNIGKAIGTVILVIIFLAVTTSLFPTFQGFIDNATGAGSNATGFTGTAILTVAGVLYWIIVSASVILALMEGLGLFELMKKFNKLS